MDATTQTRLARRLLDLHSRGVNDNFGCAQTLDAEVYTDADRFAREREALRRTPLLIGFAQDIAAGQTIARDHLGVPLLVTRREDGELIAHLNACRHRGARLLDCETRKSKLTCPFHGWTYAVTGELIGLPDRDSFAGVGLDTLTLTRLPVREHHGQVWVVPSPTSSVETLDAFLDHLPDDFRVFGFEDATHFYTENFEYDFNWKLGYETFLESYHFAALHKSTLSNVFVSNLATFDRFGRTARGAIARRSLLDQDPHKDIDLLTHSAIIYTLAPHTILFWQGDHYEIWRVFPGDRPGHARLQFSLYAPGSINGDKAKAHWQANVDLALSVIRAEDFPSAESIQKAIDSGALPKVVHGANEPGLTFFHRGLDDLLADVAMESDAVAT